MFINCKTNYSLRWGVLSIEELVNLAKNFGMESLALTDINNTSASMDFVKRCREAGIKPVLGIEFRDAQDQLLYIGLSQNREGLRELNRFLTDHSLNKMELPAVAPPFTNAYVIYPLGRRSPRLLRENEFTGVRVSEVNKLFTSEYRKAMHKIVALHPLTFADDRGWHLHRLLRSIDNNTLLSKLTPANLSYPDEKSLSPGQMREIFRAYPQVICNTEQLMDNCSVEIKLHTNKNRRTFTLSRSDDMALLEKLAHEGMAYRYQNDRYAQERVQKELKVIDELGFSAYFLITWDIIRYARSRGYHHVGRGSGANSTVAYCMGITDVDPIELDLYFERFINKHRTSPPDFDIDFSWDERDEVIDYIFKRYGRQHTALIATYSTFKGASIVRELGKVFGLPKPEIDRLVNRPHHPDNKTDFNRKMMVWADRLQGFPNHLGIHAGGVLITEEDINYHTSLQMMPKGFPITHFDMHVAEDYGFYKYDILSQRGLGHIKESVSIVQKNQGIHLDIHDVKRFKTDPKTQEQLRKGQAIGCFYVESPAMRGLLTKLHCDNYLSLVAASSIIRPGVAKSGMMKEYIKRFHRPDQVEYLHPKMAELLQETYGVMVYQEDVIKVAHHFGGLDLAEADVLRRMMSGKSRGKVKYEQIREKFFANCESYGYPVAITAEVWRQIESFSGYSFSKAHSASYAVESFQSLYLKAHYPLEFMVAVINNFGGFYRAEIYFHEARRAGATIHPPCVNHSTFLTRISGTDIHTGFVHVKGLERKFVQEIVSEREREGEYRTLEDFLRRVNVGREQLEMLVRLNALRFTGKPKQQLYLETALRMSGNAPPIQKSVLFQTEPAGEFTLPVLENTELIDRYDELELIGFPIADPYVMLKTKFRGEVMGCDMLSSLGKTVRMVGYYVTAKQVITSRKEMMRFGTFLDANGDHIDTVHFPQSLMQYPFQGRGFYLLLGKVVEEFGFPSLEVQKMALLPMLTDPRWD